MKSLGTIDSVLAALLIYGGLRSRQSRLVRYSNYAAALYLSVGAFYNFTGRVQLVDKSAS